jgi:hypothetical protein
MAIRSQFILMGLLIPIFSSSIGQAQQMPGTPRQGLTPGGCRWLVPWGMEYAQPKQLKPNEVPGKNAKGCLSQNDATYGVDGCPLKFCQYGEIGPLPTPIPLTDPINMDRITPP